MPKNLSLFGAHLRNLSEKLQRKFRKTQIMKIIPVKPYGRQPSAASQMALWHGDDFNYRTRVSRTGATKTRYKTTPLNYRKDVHSRLLNTVIPNLRMTPSALYAIDDSGGFDNYIMRTSPEEMRSCCGEKMREVAYFYMDQPALKEWALPWKVFLRKRNRADPWYARYVHLLKKEKSEKALANQHAKYSPYFLPKNPYSVARQEYMAGGEGEGELNLWWKKSPALERAFRQRLREAKSFEQRHASHREPDGFRMGDGMGGGGPSGVAVRKRSKTHKARTSRPY